MFNKLLSHIKPTPSPANPTPTARKAPPKPFQTHYVSLPVPIPPSFLSTTNPPADAQPVTASRIDWATTSIPENGSLYAVVLDHVLSPSECAALLALAEASVPPAGEKGGELRGGEAGEDPWGPALVNVGSGFEVLEKDYRNGERIVWDCQEVVDRIWERCLQGEGGQLRERFEVIGKDEVDIVGRGRDAMREGRWEFLRVNERMRFLRYGKGGFFRPHCDSPYADMSDPPRTIRTMFTIHLYLNDSKAEAEDAELVGGATSFFSNDEKRKIDVNPKAGRVLIFQHRRLLHSGDDVLAGTKYTMRTDIMYEFKDAETEAAAAGTEGMAE